jgi:phosphoribosylformylglycinamidine cyclo-ligase
MTKQRKAYARAGVDVDLGNRLKRRIQTLVRQTHGPQVLGKIGGFGGLFRADFRSMRDPILVSSIDSVGTKLKIAFALDRHDTVGADMVNHCVNDIAVVRYSFSITSAAKNSSRGCSTNCCEDSHARAARPVAR